MFISRLLDPKLGDTRGINSFFLSFSRLGLYWVYNLTTSSVCSCISSIMYIKVPEFGFLPAYLICLLLRVVSLPLFFSATLPTMHIKPKVGTKDRHSRTFGTIKDSLMSSFL